MAKIRRKLTKNFGEAHEMDQRQNKSDQFTKWKNQGSNLDRFESFSKQATEQEREQQK